MAIATLVQSDALHYDTTLSKWVNKPLGWYTAAAGFVYQNLVTDLTSWTHAGTTGTVDSSVEQTTGVTSILEVFGQGNQFNVGASLAGCTISFYAYLVPNPANSTWCPCYFQFGCDSLGNGVALALLTGLGRTGLMGTTSWNPPLPGGGIGNVTASTWHQIIITINAAGTQASWTNDGIPGETNVAVTLSGNYIGLNCNGTYGGNMYVSKIQIQSSAGENWTTSRTVSGGVSTLAFTYSGTNTPAVQIPGLVTPINPQAASYTAVLGDANNLVTINNASANTFTIPLNASVAFAIGTTLSVAQAGAGQVTLTPASGVTLNTPSSLTTRALWSTVSLLKTATDVWLVGGDLT